MTEKSAAQELAFLKEHWKELQHQYETALVTLRERVQSLVSANDVLTEKLANAESLFQAMKRIKPQLDAVLDTLNSSSDAEPEAIKSAIEALKTFKAEIES